MRWVVIAVLGVACDNSKSASPAAGSAASAPAETAQTSSFALTVVGDGGKVNVELAAPGTWRSNASDPPSWAMAGARMLALAAASPGRGDTPSRVGTAIKMQYGDLGGATRSDYPDGRVWIAHPEGANVHARMFVPYARMAARAVNRGPPVAPAARCASTHRAPGRARARLEGARSRRSAGARDRRARTTMPGRSPRASGDPG